MKHWLSIRAIRALAGACIVLLAATAEAAQLQDVRLRHHPDRTRLVFDLSSVVKYRFLELSNPARIAIDLYDVTSEELPREFSSLGPYIAKVRTGRHDDRVRYVIELKQAVRLKHFTLAANQVYGDRVVVDLLAIESAPSATLMNPEHAMRDDQFVVAIDPGHGGEDPGAVGPKRTFEKHVVLQISKELKRQIDSVPGMMAELTRKGDYYIPLRKRIELAAANGSDLFISIHADAFTRRSAAGISVFRLSQRGASSEQARRLAAKENASDLLGGAHVHSNDPDLHAALTNMAYSAQINRSTHLADRLLRELRSVGKMHGDRVEHAGFAVLKSSIPSVLIETGFISNPTEEQKLRSAAYQRKLAKAIRKGVEAFASKDPVIRETAWYKTNK